MNWTGGYLSMRSRKGAGVSLNARQRAHFAKAQDNPRNGARKQILIKTRHERQSSLEHHLVRSNHAALDRDRPLSLQPQHCRQRMPKLAKQELILDNGLRSAARLPGEKRKRETNTSDTRSYEEEVNLVAEKRRSLLEKGDWVGIKYQRPLQLAFAPSELVEYVGRRRKTTDGHQARYESRQTMMRSPFRTMNMFRSPPGHSSHGHRRTADVRIHIGKRIIPPGISSSTAPSKSHEITRHQQSRTTSQITSSDVMLLDNEDILSYHGHSSGGVHKNRKDMVSGDKRKDNNWVSQRGSNEQNLAPGYHRFLSTEIQDTHIIDNRDNSTSPIWRRTSVSFSPASIKHPVPRSSKISSVLRSSSSEIAESNVAQVGNAIPVVPSSQMLDHEIWETWMAPLYSEEALYERVFDGGLESVGSISPGISRVSARQTKCPTLLRQQGNAMESSSDGAKEIDSASTRVNLFTGGFQNTEDDQEERQPPQYVERIRQPIRDKMRRSKWDGSKHNRNVQGETERNAVAQAHTTTKSRKEQALDEIWKAFVFGSDEIDEKEHPPDTLLSLRCDSKKLPSSSVLANCVVVPDQFLRTGQTISNECNSISEFHTSRTTNSGEVPWNLPAGISLERAHSPTDCSVSLHALNAPLNSTQSRCVPACDVVDFSPKSDDATTPPTIVSSSESRESRSSEGPTRLYGYRKLYPRTQRNTREPESSQELLDLSTRSPRILDLVSQENTRKNLEDSKK